MESCKLQRKYVFDGIQRLLHAWIGFLVLGLIVLGWIGKGMDAGEWHLRLVQWHITLGYGLIVGLVLRWIWGFIGPEEARLSRLFPSSRRLWGHEPLASLAYLFLYGVLLLAAISGLVLAAIQYDRGPWAERFFDDFTWHALASFVHESVLYISTLFILLHIGALIFHEKERGYPLAQAMLSGYQYRPLTQEYPAHEKSHSFDSHVQQPSDQG
jgi:cytochrome b